MGGIARIVGSHFRTASGLFMRIPIMKTTKGSSVLAVNLPGITLGTIHFSFARFRGSPTR
jgi:hypothetical protein